MVQILHSKENATWIGRSILGMKGYRMVRHIERLARTEADNMVISAVGSAADPHGQQVNKVVVRTRWELTLPAST